MTTEAMAATVASMYVLKTTFRRADNFFFFLAARVARELEPARGELAPLSVEVMDPTDFSMDMTLLDVADMWVRGFSIRPPAAIASSCVVCWCESTESSCTCHDGHT